MRWTTLCIAACWLLAADPAAARTTRAMPPHDALRDTSCVRCHRTQQDVLRGPMATRAGERAFARRAFGREGDAFFAGSCSGCHVRSCDDCHRVRGRFVARPADEQCLACHRGYWVGWDYHGRAPREDHERYQRGQQAQGERVLRMTPDVHQQAGMACTACHTLHGGANGRGAVKSCESCHARLDLTVPEHAIGAHLERMECSACHSAWAAQEYATFLVRPRTPEQEDAFALLPSWGEWRKSAALHRQDAPPLGLNAAGRVSPIRPVFQLFATDTRRGWENHRLATEWRAFFPHTVRRGGTTCTGCHDRPRRFLLEPFTERIHHPDEDGLPLRSYWDRSSQTMANGSFFPEARYRKMNERTPQFVREHLKQWQGILRRVAPSSPR